MMGMDVTGDVACAMVKAFVNETGTPWPPEGECDVPTLPCEADFVTYIATAIAEFQKTGPTHDELNELSALAAGTSKGGQQNGQQNGQTKKSRARQS